MVRIAKKHLRIVLFDNIRNGQVGGRIICVGRNGFPLHEERFHSFIGHKRQIQPPQGVDFHDAEAKVLKLEWTSQSKNIEIPLNCTAPTETSGSKFDVLNDSGVDSLENIRLDIDSMDFLSNSIQNINLNPEFYEELL